MAWPKIAEARKAKGWSQQELADRTGIAQPNIARMETSDVDIKASTMLKLSATLGVTISYLLGVDVVDGVVCHNDERATELTDLFNAMDPESRDALMVVARALAR